MMKIKPARTAVNLAIANMIALSSATSRQTSSVAFVVTPATWLVTARIVNVEPTGATTAVALAELGRVRLALVVKPMLLTRNTNLSCKSCQVELLLVAADRSNVLKVVLELVTMRTVVTVTAMLGVIAT
jgi:hypothetical protein